MGVLAAGLDIGDLGAGDGGEGGAGADEGGFGEAQEGLGEAAPLGPFVGIAVEGAEEGHAGAEEAQDPGEGAEGGIVDVGQVGAQDEGAVQRAERERRWWRGCACRSWPGWG